MSVATDTQVVSPPRAPHHDRAGSQPGFLRRHGTLIAATALIGALLGGVVAFVLPAHYRSEVGVLITILDRDDVSTEEALRADADFANSLTVLNRVRGAIPDAPDRVDVSIDADQSIIRLVASDSSADEALRLARTWSSTFISERRRSMIETRAEQVDNVEAELSSMVTAIGSARLAADDAEAARLEQRRIALTEEQAELEGELAALQSGVGAEVVESPVRPTGRSGVGLLPASLLGLVLGGLIGLLAAVSLDRLRRRTAEDDVWLEDADFAPIDLVELAAASAQEDAAQTGPPTLQDLAPVPGRTSTVADPPLVSLTDTVDLGSDGLGPSIFTEATAPTDDAPVPGRFSNDGAAVAPASATVDLTPPLITIDLASPPPQPSGPTNWLHDPMGSLGRTRVPTSRRETPDDVRIVDLTRTEQTSRTDRLATTSSASTAGVSASFDAWSDDLSLLPD